MTRTPLAATLLACATLLAFLGGLGCVNPHPGDTSSTMLYAFDDATHTVLAWNDVNTIYDLPAGTTAAPAPDRTITSTLLNAGPLAWGGLVCNPSTNELFLVYEQGTVVRIEKSRTANGALSNTLDIVSFTLGQSSDRLPSSIFSQASVDPSTGTLYVTETGSDSQCRVWVISGAANVIGEAAPGTYIQTPTSDTGGTGVTVAGSGSIVAFFTGGQQIYDTLGTYYTGPRIRLSAGTTFPLTSNVLVGTTDTLGSTTLLWDGTNTPAYGTLAYDSVANLLYVARPITSGAAVLSFYQSQFTGGKMSQTPGAPTLTDAASSLPNLRFIAHARVKDWLAGADLVAGSATTTTTTTTTTGTGTNTLRLWKGPSQGTLAGTYAAFTLGAGVQIRGLAMDGSQ